MKPMRRWIFLILVIAVLSLSACAKPAATGAKSQPASLAPITGTDIKQVKLTDQAAKRIDIQTAAVTNGKVSRTQVIGGEVVTNPNVPAASAESTSKAAAPAATGDAWVRVVLNTSDLKNVDWDRSALILSLDKGSGTAGMAADWVKVTGAEPAEEGEETQTSYYVVKDGGKTLPVGQLVGVELPLLTNGIKRIVVPYASVIYNQKGETWVYTNPNALTFVRRPIVVDYIEGDQAFLTVGPPSGTKVVTVGVAELFGAETGVSK